MQSTPMNIMDMVIFSLFFVCIKIALLIMLQKLADMAIISKNLLLFESSSITISQTL